MKTVLTILLCAALLLSLCGCGAGNDAPTGAPEGSSVATTVPVTEAPAETTEATAAQTQQNQANECYRDSSRSFSSLDEYDAFLTEEAPPSLKVTYHGFAQLGQFESVTFYNAYSFLGSDYTRSAYSLKAAGGTVLVLWIDHDETPGQPPQGIKAVPQERVDPADMRTIARPLLGYYPGDQFYYLYSKGKLIGFQWETGGLEYRLTVEHNGTLENYPLDSAGDFISGLLKQETANGSMAQLGIFKD